MIEAIADHAAFRRVRRLQPAGGAGDKLFPPTYPPPPGARRDAPPRHVFERRRVDDGDVWCVLIDSVQSQANRLEEALLAAADRGRMKIPYVTVDFNDAGLDLDRAEAQAIYGDAYARAESAGFRFESISLKPQEKLVEIVRRSRELALEGAGGEDSEDS